MSMIEPAQGNQKLMRADVPALPVELTRLKLSTLTKEVSYYNVPFMHVTIGSWPMSVDKQGMNMTVGTVARINPLMARVRSRTLQFVSVSILPLRSR